MFSASYQCFQYSLVCVNQVVHNYNNNVKITVYNIVVSHNSNNVSASISVVTVHLWRSHECIQRVSVKVREERLETFEGFVVHINYYKTFIHYYNVCDISLCYYTIGGRYIGLNRVQSNFLFINTNINDCKKIVFCVYNFICYKKHHMIDELSQSLRN